MGLCSGNTPRSGELASYPDGFVSAKEPGTLNHESCQDAHMAAA